MICGKRFYGQVGYLTWGDPPPCNQALNQRALRFIYSDYASTYEGLFIIKRYYQEFSR